MSTLVKQPRGGALEMTFRPDGRGRTVLSHLYRRVPIIVQQALYFDEQLPDMACIYILSSGGPTLEGDHSQMAILLEPHSMVHISTGAATIVASMAGGRASMRQHFVLREGSYLEWLPQPIVPSAGADFATYAEIVADPTASLFWSEVVTCGRLYHGERFSYRRYAATTILKGTDGELLFCDNLSLEPSYRSPEEWALLGGFSHLGSVVILTPEEQTAELREQIVPMVGPEMRMSVGEMANHRGLVVRLVGNDTGDMLATIRGLCSLVRQSVKGLPLQAEFPWRGAK